jgi:hypothetical protein
MYLVELRPGKEELYRSSDELALAIRNGEVDAGSRVYHRATAKWISITLHPQYKAIVAASKEGLPGRPVRRGWGILGGGSGQNTAQLSSEQDPTSGPRLHRWRRPLALGITGLLLLSGIQLAFSGPRPPWTSKARVPSARPLKTASTPIRIVAETPVDEGEEQHQLASLASAPALTPKVPARRSAALLPRAPRLRSRSLRDALAPGLSKPGEAVSFEGVYARYQAAHDAARSRLETGLRVARVGRLFAAPRLSASGGVSDTRMSLAGAANFIRVFRREQATIDESYQDSVVQLAKQHGWTRAEVRNWYSRPSAKETPELELITNKLLASIDSVYAILTAQAGAYKVRGSAIAFEDPSAGQAYGAMRRQIKEQIDAAVSAGGATSSGPAGFLLRAVGTTSLPRET